MPRLLGKYEGASPIPIVPDVYKWDGKQLVKADGEFKDYYATVVLPRLKTAMAELNQKQVSTGTANDMNSRDKRQEEAAATNAKLRDKYSREMDEVNKIINQ